MVKVIEEFVCDCDCRDFKLEDGTVLYQCDWNGEKYIVKKDGKEVEYTPVYSYNIPNDYYQIVGFEVN